MTPAPHADSCAVVTGGSQGLGLAIAQRLVAEGCRKLVIAARDADKGALAAAQLSAQGVDAHFEQVDMGDVDSVRALVASAADRMGKVTALANAAALTDRGSVLETTPQEWDRMFAVNSRGPFFAIQEVAKRAIAAEHPARVVNILTMSAYCGQTFLAAYSASKGALAITTKNAANALRHNGIRVNGINCGWMDTPGEDAVQRKWHGAGDDWLEKAEAAQPLGQLVKPGDVAVLASYLLGPQSGVMTGALIDFDQNVAGSFPE
jgi:NAD(P)-dependent dehydrogenase (short-subunit alcohol dehydrogenase family)